MQMKKFSDIHIRDPFILPLKDQRCYWLFGSTDLGSGAGDGKNPFVGDSEIAFGCYKSEDLVNWEGPFPAFRKPDDFEKGVPYWAPECHQYHGAFYLFATMAPTLEENKGTWILRADKPEGPYQLWSDGPITPRDWQALDGTFYVDEKGTPYMIFCHEWIQIGNGTVCAVELSADLKHAIGAPQVLFSAEDASWTMRFTDSSFPNAYVTDGPFVYHYGKALRMLWSSFSKDGYTMGMTESESGSILGPWKHLPEVVFAKDGGHGMYFRDFDGKGYVILHQPNVSPNERPMLFPMELN